MRIVFMGSAELACASLDAVHARAADEVVGVVTQPARPRGRRLQEQPCPAAAHAETLGLPVLTPENVNTTDSLDALRALRPELVVVVAYGQILRAPLLALPPQGSINVHTSLLPRYRGAAPIQWAIVNGETETGVTTMRIAARMDAGDILQQRVVPIGPEDTAGSLHDRLAGAGAELLDRTLDALADGTLTATPQVEADATYAPKLSKADGRIDWHSPAPAIYNRVRGFNPYPGCFCYAPRGADAPLRVHAVRVEHAPVSAPPGRVLACDDEGPLITAGEQAVRLCAVQPAGGKRMSGAAWLRGHALAPGDEVE